MSTTTLKSLPVFDEHFHKCMWLWLAEHPGMDGRDIFRVHGFPPNALLHCERDHICKYAQHAWRMCGDEYKDSCGMCPLQFRRDLDKWGKIPCLGGAYLGWSDATTAVRNLEDNPNNPRTIEGLSLDTAKRLCRMYAKSIANMPVRNGVRCA